MQKFSYFFFSRALLFFSFRFCKHFNQKLVMKFIKIWNQDLILIVNLKFNIPALYLLIKLPGKAWKN